MDFLKHSGAKSALAKKLQLLEKRLVLALLVIFLGAIIVGNERNLSADYQISDDLEKKANFVVAVDKIRERSDWQPQGFGSGEYLNNIPKIKAGAVIDLLSGEVLWSMNLGERISPASLSKISTVMTALDVAPIDSQVIISEKAVEQIPTKLGLKVGESLMLDEAITAAVMTSANDATWAIAQSLGNEIGDGVSTFMELVNIKLQKMGAADSHFVTPTGLDEQGHFSTVYDLAIMAHEARVNYPLIAEVAGTSYKRLPANSNHRVIDLPNWNALLGTYPGVNGLKIGYTETAGHVTMVTATREGRELVAIVIGAKSLEDREIAAVTLLNYGFSKFNIEPFPVNQLDLVGRFEDWRRQLSQGGP